MKKLLQAIFLGGSLFVGAASATDVVDVVFQGSIFQNTCDVLVDGDADPLVRLPIVNATEVQGNVMVGETPFTLSLVDCKMSETDAQFAIRFIPTQVDPVVPTLMANVGGTATGVGLYILNAPGGSPMGLGMSAQPFDLPVLSAGQSEVSHTFAVAYGRNNTGVGPGSVVSSVQYVISYP